MGFIMGFTEQSRKRMEELVGEINSREKEHLYLNTPALLEIERIVEKELGEKNDSETLLGAVFSFRFLAECYSCMDRPSEAGRIYTRAIEMAALLYREHGVIFETIDNLVFYTFQYRNAYFPDECDDIIRLVEKIASPEKLSDAKLLAKPENRMFIKRDPVEMTREYLNVIDEVEAKIAKNRRYHGFGSCHHVWSLKKDYLKEYGIEWEAPSDLNPSIMFD